MKNIITLLASIIAINSWAVAPYGIKGQAQSGTLYSNVHQFPNNQVTNTGGINALVETGNKNILINPSFEHLTFSTGWTNSAGTFVEETVIDIDGLKSAKVTLSAQALALSQDSTLYQAQFADGVQGLASVRIKTSVSGLRVCSRQNAVVTSNLCVSVQANGKWGLYKVPFTLGGTSNGISINSNGTSVTGDVYIDDAFVGAVDLSATVDQSRIAGESYFAGTTSCLWSRTSTTLGPFTATAACPGPIVNYSSMGQWQTTDSDLPRQTVNNLPAGVYKATFIVNVYSSVSSANSLTINDGTTSCVALIGNSSNISGVGIISCVFTYASSGNRVFEIYGASGASTINIENNVAITRNTKFTLEYYGSGTTYSSTNADTDWAACNFSTLAWQGLGTVTNNLFCKRNGGDLLIHGKFTTGTTSASEGRMPLPLWDGVQLTSSSSRISSGVNFLGEVVRVGISGTTYFESGILVQPNVSYLNFGTQQSTTSVGTILNGNSVFGSSEVEQLETIRIPIESWQQSNIIIGQFNGLESCTNTLECTDTFSLYSTSAGVVSSENIDWVNGNATLSDTSLYTFSLRTGLVTTGMACTAGSTNVSTDNRDPYIVSTSSTQVIVRVLSSSAGTNAAGSFSLICQKQGVDYIGKTAKAVASDQNLRTPGVTNAVFVSAEVSSAGLISQEDSDFINGSCAVTDTSLYTCTWVSGYWSSAPKCMPNITNGSQNFKAEKEAISTISSGIFRTANSTTGAKAASGFTLFCHGVKL
jgi:hypothetical protein